MKYFIYTLFFLCSMSSFSQEKTICGPMFSPEMAEVYKGLNTSVNRSAKTTNTTAENNVSVFEVKIHFVRATDGTSTYDYDESDMINSIQKVNDVFEELNIAFDYCGSDTDFINYVDDDYFYDNAIRTKTFLQAFSGGGGNTLEGELTDTYAENNVINIFYVTGIINTDASRTANRDVYQSGWSGIPFDEKSGIRADNLNYILMDYDYLNGSTLIHEMGHYFGLLHTFETILGVETCSDCLDEEGYIPCSDCLEKGDQICDTPPDNSNTYGVIENDDCTYTNKTADGCVGNTHPANNYMSYFDAECVNTFSEGQKTVMKRNAARYVSRNEFSLDCNDCQLEREVINDVASGSVNARSASSYIEANNTIFNGATANYHAGEEVLLTDGFVAESGSSFYGYIGGCEISTSSKSVNLSDINDTQELFVLEEEALEISLKVFPNPSNGVFNVQDTDNIISYAVKDLTGKQITTNKTDNQEFTIDITNFANGLYILEVQKENGEIVTKKIIKN